jgi:hypothetical protein
MDNLDFLEIGLVWLSQTLAPNGSSLHSSGMQFRKYNASITFLTPRSTG